MEITHSHFGVVWSGIDFQTNIKLQKVTMISKSKSKAGRDSDVTAASVFKSNQSFYTFVSRVE